MVCRWDQSMELARTEKKKLNKTLCRHVRRHVQGCADAKLKFGFWKKLKKDIKMRDTSTTDAHQLKTGDDASDRNLVNYA